MSRSCCMEPPGGAGTFGAVKNLAARRPKENPAALEDGVSGPCVRVEVTMVGAAEWAVYRPTSCPKSSIPAEAVVRLALGAGVPLVAPRSLLDICFSVHFSQ
jgi:hypothetical protein